jgi:hypothetical protein
MLALSIRQPFAELILRGIKTVEYLGWLCGSHSAGVWDIARPDPTTPGGAELV